MKGLRNLPIGVQTFKKMREENFVYVDKTEHVYNLAIKKGVYFLSRPRRFGKSLLLSTFKELFEGNRPLFKGLWIDDKWDWSKTSPVIHISFASMPYQGLGLKEAILYRLTEIGTEHGLVFSEDDIKVQFTELLKHLYSKHGKVVVLIDEYDKPIIDFLETHLLDQAKANQKVLKIFYSVLKDAELYIEMLFITGVSKFAKVSIFSDLNHLADLTLDRNYATLTGITQEELEFYFEDYIQWLLEDFQIERETLLQRIKDWYNGFSWDGIHTVYNPFGTLTFLGKRGFSNYWFDSGTPTFLIQLMKKNSKFDFENSVTSSALLNKYDLDNLDMVALLFQTGYLTVKKRNFLTDEIVLDYPNLEIKDSMYTYMIDALAPNPDLVSSGVSVQDLSRAFTAHDLVKVRTIINTLFTDLPAHLYESNKTDTKKELALSERFFHSIIHLLFKYLGVFIDSEVHTSTGRADSVIQTPTHIYFFEFKYNRSGKAALKQLKDKNYAEKYKITGKTLMGIGVNFSHKNRCINGWLVEELK
jgi:Predicted AAA-ATPase/PD-(D/E)XK nuclease superfamily